MASEERNALAELADTLCGVVVDDECYATVGECINATNAIKKAQRIIAELAKVETDGYGNPWEDALLTAFEQCRAIAEEGGQNV